MANVDRLAQTISELALSDWLELQNRLRTLYGMTVSVSRVRTPASEPLVDVIYHSGGEKKISGIKFVRDLLGLGLRQAKDLVESAPQLLKRRITRAEAEEIRRAAEAAGSIVEIK